MAKQEFPKCGLLEGHNHAEIIIPFSYNCHATMRYVSSYFNHDETNSGQNLLALINQVD